MDEKVGSDVDGYSVVAGHWPLAGPFSPVRTAYAAQALRSLVAYLGHAVATVEGLGSRQDADRVLAAVGEALTGLPSVAVVAEKRRPSLGDG
ncbi:hypothetical protein [Cryptosporangium minutisporangium]|uniref:Uncharacterized protein n=1 Tax=Cryptosporangium minutisporangium TaxID=113569 RepID=A0ABP6SUK9_9ACTN